MSSPLDFNSNYNNNREVSAILLTPRAPHNLGRKPVQPAAPAKKGKHHLN